MPIAYHHIKCTARTMSKKTQSHPKKPLTHSLSQPIDTVEYTVSSSDTLPGIAAKFDAIPSELTKLNKLTSRLIFPGQILLVPKKTNDIDISKESKDDNSSSVSEKQENKPLECKDISQGTCKTLIITEPEQSSNSSEKNEKISKFLKITSRYITDGQGVVSGVLIITPNAVMFDPNVSDPLVIEHGIENYGVIASIDMVMKAAIYYDIAHMAVSHLNEVPRNIPKPEMYERKTSNHTKHDCSTEYASAGANKLKSQFDTLVFGKSDQTNEIDEVVTNSDSITKTRKIKSSEDIKELQESEDEHLPIEHKLDHYKKYNQDHRVNAKNKLSKSNRANSCYERIELFQAEINKQQIKQLSQSMYPHAHSLETASEHIKDTQIFEVQSIEEELDIEYRNKKKTMDLKTDNSNKKSSQLFTSSDNKNTNIWDFTSPLSCDYANLEEKQHLFMSFDQIISQPRPATSNYPPLYLCLRMGLPINKNIKKSSPFLMYHKKRVKREYWFSISRDRVDEVYDFFQHWIPHLYGDVTSIEAEKLGFTPINDDDNDEEMELIYEEELTQESGNSFEGAIKLLRSSPLSILKVVEDHFGGGNITKEDWEFLSMNENDKSPSSESVELPLPDSTEQSDILNDEKRRELCKHLPPRALGYCWSLIYSTSKHGFSLKTMYRKMCGIETPVLVTICDTNGAIFGAMSSCPLKVSEHFYGTGECFLYSFYNGFKHYPWSGDNMYFIKGNPESLAFGAGDGHFGLWLDGDLYHGRSSPCLTFNNECLSSQEDFFIKGLETWGFV